MAKVIPHAPKPSGKKSAIIAANAFTGFNTLVINSGLLPVGYAQPEVIPGKGATTGAETAGGTIAGKVGIAGAVGSATARIDSGSAAFGAQTTPGAELIGKGAARF